MKMNNSPRRLALSILDNFGIDKPSEIDVLDIIDALDIPIKFSPLSGCDGRIIHGKEKSLIAINDEIAFESRKRFTIAHELGHYLMHKSDPISHTDNVSTMSWFNNKNKHKTTKQEYEANVFASELLLPTSIFEEEVKGSYFSPELIREISDKHRVSRSSIIHRLVESGNHPICVFYTRNNKVHYWRKSDDFKYKIKDITKISPPIDSVSAEYFTHNRIYSIKDSTQEILKSTWLEVKEENNDDLFYEFCMVYSDANLAISVIWED
jgi:Zn-dependent peptidase ImmA (M78 family)